MVHPLVRELAGDGIPVAVTCRVLNLARQPYYRWLAPPVTNAELTQASRANAHLDDSKFGYRFLVEEARETGESMAERTTWEICSRQGWRSAFGKRRGNNGKKLGPKLRDDLCAVTDPHAVIGHEFRAQTLNQWRFADITEHRTRQGKLYLCAVKDAYFNRIVGYLIDSRMESRLAVEALNNAVARRQ